MTRWRLALLSVVLFAGAAWACPVCGLPSEQGQGAYLFMTGIMSLLPLALLGGVVTWVVLRVKRADAESPDERK
ncbi:MAG: hypothetical protein IT380_29235 [Myxococcales bacterium]|nr:hypothetical protein [Myxococcales bacterium]